METHSRESSNDPKNWTGRKKIKTLDQDVVNRIAAGEVVQRPVSAIKELIENSIDAGSTNIRVSIKDGGIELLQVQDNGKGIDEADLDLLCKRFATSKLSSVDDFKTLATFGFRGEALASLSHVSRLSVTTKTPDAPTALKAEYEDGSLLSANRTAGTQGTTVTAESIFYNTPLRKRALGSPSEETSRITELVMLYSLRYPYISFSCRRIGVTRMEVATTSSQQADATKQLIGSLFGYNTARELLHILAEGAEESKVRIEGYVSQPNFALKKYTFILFINGRLVQSRALKKAIESLYASHLPKDSHPFVYLSLDVDPSRVDCNVHPTKAEVFLQDQDEIFAKVAKQVDTAFESQSRSKSFNVKLINVGETPRKPDVDESRAFSSQAKDLGLATQKVLPYKMIRSDASNQRVDDMFKDSTHVKRARVQSVMDRSTDCDLTSVQELRRAIIEACHQGTREALENHVFVGVVEKQPLTLSLVQHETHLYLVDHGILAEELVYQLGLRFFGEMPCFKFPERMPVLELIKLGLSDDDQEAVADTAAAFLQIWLSFREMLQDFFSLHISEDGELLTFPKLLPEYEPDWAKLPWFFVHASQGNWEDEKECLDMLLHCVAMVYSPRRIPGISSKECSAHVIEHVLFPAVRKNFYPPQFLMDSFQPVASLTSLYRVFERC